MSALGGDVYGRTPDPRYAEETVQIFDKNTPDEDGIIRPENEDLKSRSKMMTREVVSRTETIQSGEL